MTDNTSNKCDVKFLDPVQGLVDYVNDIKPFHTKIMEVLIEYVYTDIVDATVIEDLRFEIGMDYYVPESDILACGSGYGLLPYGSPLALSIGSPSPHTTYFDYPASTANTFIVPGDHTAEFPTGSQPTVEIWIEDSTGAKFLPTDGTTPGTFTTTVTVDTVEFFPQQVDYYDPIAMAVVAGDSPHTVVTVTGTPLPTVVEIADPTNPGYNKVITGEATAESLAITGLDDSYTFIVSGDYTFRFQQGYPLTVNGSNADGTYTVLASRLVGSDTYITVTKRIIEEPGDFIPGAIGLNVLGYGETSFFCPTLPETNPQNGLGTHASTSITESFKFGWNTTYQWQIISTNQAASEIVVSGDATHILFDLQADVNDTVTIDNSEGGVNDGQYDVISHSYDILSNTTTIVLGSPALPADTTDPNHGQLLINDIDITNWFQYLIQEMNTAGTITVNGDATGDVQVNQQIRVIGNDPDNDGLYTVINPPPTFDGVLTTITVAEPISTTLGGGTLEPARDYGMRLDLHDNVGVSIGENAQGAILVIGGNMVGGWDYPGWDIGGYDEDLGTLISLYNNIY